MSVHHLAEVPLVLGHTWYAFLLMLHLVLYCDQSRTCHLWVELQEKAYYMSLLIPLNSKHLNPRLFPQLLMKTI